MNAPGHAHAWTRTNRRDRGKWVWRCHCGLRLASKRVDGPRCGRNPWGLGEQEWKVVVALADGRSRPWICRHLGVKSPTLNLYLVRIRSKIGVSAVVGVADTASIVDAYEAYVGGRV